MERSAMAIDFDLNDLLSFRAVAELSSFRKAAESVHLSQPAFSRRIDKLEQALGVRLLERTTRRVTLTAVGRDFERKVRELLDELDATLLGIRGVAVTRMGEVTVACVPSTVKRGEADFRLHLIGAQEGELDFKPLVEERFVAACRRDHPLAKLRRVSWAQLSDYDYISVGRTSGNRVLLDHPLLVSVPLIDPVVTRKVGLIRRRGRSLSPAAQQLYDLFSEVKGRPRAR